LSKGGKADAWRLVGSKLTETLARERAGRSDQSHAGGYFAPMTDSVVTCTACEADEMILTPASISLSLLPSEGWIVEQPDPSAPPAYFCPVHADPERRARLVLGFALVCARCGRTSKDDDPPPGWWGAADLGGEPIDICACCHEAGR
jgi:hypothetical protein